MRVNSFSDIGKLNVSGNLDVKRGDIYYVYNSGTVSGSEQESGRPAVIVSSDAGAKSSSVVSVVYMTTEPKPNMLVHVDINSAKKPSTVLCEQVNTVSKNRLGDYIGKVTPDEMIRIERAIAEALGIKFGILQKNDYVSFVDESIEDELIQAVNNHVRDTLKTGEKLRTLLDVIRSVETESNFFSSGSMIDAYLPEETKESMKQMAVLAIQKSKSDLVNEIKQLIGLAEKEPTKTAAVNIVLDQKNAENHPKKKSVGITASVDEVKKMVCAGKSIADITKDLGVSLQTTYNFFDKHGIERPARKNATVKEPEPKKTTYPELTVEAVRKVYTNGTMNLTEAAKYFGKDKKEFREYVQDNHIVKPIAPAAIPHGRNKMSADEFRARMMADRK